MNLLSLFQRTTPPLPPAIAQNNPRERERDVVDASRSKKAEVFLPKEILWWVELPRYVFRIAQESGIFPLRNDSFPGNLSQPLHASKWSTLWMADGGMREVGYAPVAAHLNLGRMAVIAWRRKEEHEPWRFWDIPAMNLLLHEIPSFSFIELPFRSVVACRVGQGAGAEAVHALIAKGPDAERFSEDGKLCFRRDGTWSGELWEE